LKTKKVEKRKAAHKKRRKKEKLHTKREEKRKAAIYVTDLKKAPHERQNLLIAVVRGHRR
jgi:hypothetical protein